MAKIKINFDDSLYNIDESSFASPLAELQSHFLNKMNGSGEVLHLGGTSYNIDSTKLSNTANKFVTHLGTIAGNGKKVRVNNTEYSIDSTKVAKAVEDIRAILGGLHYEEPLAAGLYETGSDYKVLIKDWDTLVAEGKFIFDEEKSDVITGVYYTIGEGDLVISNNVTVIGKGAFKNKTSLTNIIIPNSVTTIEEEAFNGCNFTSIVIPDSVTSIGEHAFYYCRKLKSIMMSKSITTIEPCTFYGCNNLTDIVIPEGVTSIGEYAFDDCRNLTKITIPETVTIIDYRAFYGCENLANIVIPEGVTTIEEEAFYLCQSLTDIVIPSSITTIGLKAFYYAGLINITFNGTKAEWNNVGKSPAWAPGVPATHVQCSDGQVAL